MIRIPKKSFRMTRNRKVLIKNTIFLSLLQVMRYFIPILVLPYITRIIGVVHFGEISVSISVCLILQIFVDYGFNYIGVREVATHKDNIPYISYLYSSITCARCLIFLVCSVITMLLTYFIPFLAEIRLLVFIALFPVLFSIFMPEWIYQGLEEMEFITYIHVLSRIIYVVLIFTLIKEESDYLLYPNYYMLERMMNAYLLEKVYPGKILMEGYPRNSAFFDEERREDLKSKLKLKDKEIFIYMPTFK